MTERKKIALAEGRYAYRTGDDINPYPVGNPHHEPWNLGHADAARTYGDCATRRIGLLRRVRR